MSRRFLRPALFLAPLLLAGQAFAQSAPPAQQQPPQPSVSEKYGDWQMVCHIARTAERSVQLCSITQQKDSPKGQRMLVTELRPNRDGVDGILVLPFGVAVTKPILLQVDKRSLESRPFQTCIPQGCVVPVEFVGEAFKQLQRGSRLTVTTPVANGETASESLSLKGFSKAYDRAKELTKPL
ncbi:invasion associated locus B family protein [Pseudomonas oryzihabitans]|uniref:invasion associated locus B family protein n=1 Tax=Pseudomonas oryzihabitans TaxID=47885 RepID=UPI00286600BC|nr:invasion associated locus B family protein [Pseudomonas psychrotolerans]MDR6680053.1 invasion protein IalB [Pseudomonas psychrotolerans]